MHDTTTSPTAEQRRIALAQFERANKILLQSPALADLDYAIKLLKECCRLDPLNLQYRKTLRGVEKIKFKDNQKGNRFAGVTAAPLRMRLKRAAAAGRHLQVLDLAEEILTGNPWDVPAQIAMAESFAALDAIDAAVWTLEQARQKDPDDLRVNRLLAQMYERAGRFAHAHAIWILIRRLAPTDQEAQRKVMDLAANEAIAKLDQDEATAPTVTDSQTKPRLEAEIDAIRQRIDADPSNVSLYVRLADMHVSRRDWDSARSVLNEGLARCGHAFELAWRLVELDIYPFRHNLAVIEKRLSKKPNDDRLQKLKHEQKKEILSRELELHRQKADHYPTELSHRLEVGIRLLKLGRIDEAIQELQAAKTDPRLKWKALMYLGFSFKARDNWRLAQRNFEDALRELPAGETKRKKEILFQLAEGCAEAGDLDSALEWGYELANEDFSYKNIGQKLDAWRTRTEQVQQ